MRTSVISVLTCRPATLTRSLNDRIRVSEDDRACSAVSLARAWSAWISALAIGAIAGGNGNRARLVPNAFSDCHFRRQGRFGRGEVVPFAGGVGGHVGIQLLVDRSRDRHVPAGQHLHGSTLQTGGRQVGLAPGGSKRGLMTPAGAGGVDEARDHQDGSEEGNKSDYDAASCVC